MSKAVLFINAVVIILISCNTESGNESKTGKDTTTSKSSATNAPSSVTGCYSMVQQRDSVLLNLHVTDSVVTGNLQFRRFEKDRNNGTIQGVVRGDMIIANYTFQSEGTTSVREVVFFIRNGSLFEGYGEIVVKNDTAKFVDTGQLQFMESPYVRVTCVD